MFIKPILLTLAIALTGAGGASVVNQHYGADASTNTSMQVSAQANPHKEDDLFLRAATGIPTTEVDGNAQGSIDGNTMLHIN